MSFEKLNLHEEVFNGLRDMGFESPTPIQEACIPLILEGRDILASAQTGTGKTAAFAIPVLQKILEKKKKNQSGIRALVITPTRELASQVDEAFFAIGYHTGLSTARVYGGDDWSRQEKALNKGTNIIVATPGRLLDHIKIHDVDFSNLDFLILDEADRMLDMGFIPDITHIVSKLPKERQTLLFSATLPPKIVQLARNMMNDPERVNMAPLNTAAEGVTQGMYYVDELDKLPLVLHLYEKENWASAIIFMSTKRAVDKLGRELKKKGASVTSIHGDRTQAEREKALESFRKGEFRIIVATDVMSRGIDVEGISHIINFSVPHDVEDYVHRIGRTARAEATGDAITLVSGQDRRYMESIIRVMKSKISKLEVPDLGKGDPSGSKTDRVDTRRQPSRGKGRRPVSGKQEPRSGEQQPSTGKQDQPTGKQDPSTSKQEPSTGKQEPSTGKQGPSTSKQEPSTGKQEPSSGKAGDEATEERPKRRRGRKRPGGNRTSGPRPEQSARSGSDEKSEDPQSEKGDARSGKTGSRSKSGPTRSGKDSGRSGSDDTGPDDPRNKKGKSERSVDQDRKNRRGGKSRQRRTAKDGDEDSGRQTRQKGRPRGRKRSPASVNKEKSRSPQETKLDTKRKELFDNITSPDMERVNKAVEKKKGLWSRVKGLLGGD